MKSKAYRAMAVKEVKVDELVACLADGPAYAGLDVGKGHTMVVIRDAQGTTLRPWKVRQPGEIRPLVEKLQEVHRLRPLVVALEPTGTYGDPLRQALCDVGLEVHRVSPKATCDYAEVFDGVPSQHDGKDAAIVAELAAIGKSRPWPLSSAHGTRWLYDVQWMDTQQDILQLWLGRVEALLARHWPELTLLLELNSNTLLQLLAHYGGPQSLGEDPQAAAWLAAWGRVGLKPEKIAAVLSSATSTVGVRMEAAEVEFVKRCAGSALAARQAIRQVQKAIEQRAADDASVQRVSQAVGVVTACVLAAMVGDPQDYSSGKAYRKALGLNLKERSSGKHQGHLKITKRGPSLARRWLYFAALRLVQHPAVRPWYESKKRRCEDRGGKAVVAVMRKLALAIYAVAGGANFDATRLFPGRSVCGESWLGSAGGQPPGPRNLSHCDQSGTGQNEPAGAKDDSRPADRSASVSARRSGRFPPEPYPPRR